MDQLRANFEKFYEASKKDWEPVSIKELLWNFYSQGHIDPTPVGTEISAEEVTKMVEDQCFFDFVKSCIEDPNQQSTNVPSDYVTITYPCTAIDKEKCVAWPDRCEDVGGDGTICKRIINLSKLCGVENSQSIFVKDKQLVTSEEAALLASTLSEYFAKAKE